MYVACFLYYTTFIFFHLSGVRQKFAFLCVVEITEAFPETDEICNPLVSLGLVWTGPPRQGGDLKSETEPRPLCPSGCFQILPALKVVLFSTLCTATIICCTGFGWNMCLRNFTRSWKHAQGKKEGQRRKGNEIKSEEKQKPSLGGRKGQA